MTRQAENADIILSTNTHVPYLSMLSKIPNKQFIIFSRRYQGRDWQNQYRPLPSNCIHVAIDNPILNDFYLGLALQAKKIILHCFDDLKMFCSEKSKLYPQLQKIPKIYVFHNSSFTEFGNIPEQEKMQRIQNLHRVFVENNIRPVFISKFKQESWHMAGDIILPGIDTSEFVNCWTGRNNKIKFNDKFDNFSLRVCSNFEHRDFMNGYKIGNNVLGQSRYPSIVLGEGNNNVREKTPNTIFAISNNLENYKEYLSMARFLFSANIDKFEDWYNLSSLEAVAVGTPVLMTYHDKQNNIPDFQKYFPMVSDDYGHLVSEAKKMFMDYDYAQNMSQLQRGFVEKYFSLSRFVARWTEVLK